MIVKTRDPQWVAIHRIADQIAPELRDEFLKAFTQLARLLPLNELTELIETESFAELQSLVSKLQLPRQDTVAALLATAAYQAAEITATGLELSFTLDNPTVIRWAEKYTADLFLNLSQETSRAVADSIADIVTRGFVEGIPPRTQARQMRRVIGLTERDTKRVNRFLTGQLDSGIPTKRAEQMAERMTARLLKARTETIARTESINAAQRGKLLSWYDAADNGLLDPTRTRRVWVATLDDRTCPICSVLDGKTVGFYTPFQSTVQAVDFTDNKDSFTIRSTKPLKEPITTMSPTAHPRCRCDVALRSD